MMIQKFKAFLPDISLSCLPEKFALMNGGQPHELCVAAALDLQKYLKNQQDWEHNFGLNPKLEGTIIGKMFGVLVVKTNCGETGYLAAFSGKMAGVNQLSKFVPPIFDLLEEGNFFNVGMQELTRKNERIKSLQALKDISKDEQITGLQLERKEYSHQLQQEIFRHYFFINKAGDRKDLQELFAAPQHKNPPAGAGECAGIKLLQYAFQQKMQPLALAEFWWGQSPKSANWKHGQYYDCCKEKCAPILAFMLDGVDE